MEKFKDHVLRKNHEFQKIIGQKSKDNRIVNKFIVLYFRDNNYHLKVGISISKRFANAVYRNRYRRQVREILMKIDKWDIKKDIVLILRKDFLTLKFQEKINVIETIFERL